MGSISTCSQNSDLEAINSEVTKKIPKVFISYSQSSPEHQQWVAELGNDLCRKGVKIFCDIFDLKGGQDINFYMQKICYPEIDKVLLICDKTYAEKANERRGGVGAEIKIATSTLCDPLQTRFLPIIRETTAEGIPYLPLYCEGMKYINFSQDNQYEEKLNELLREIFDEPYYRKAPLGNRPDFLLKTRQTDSLSTECLERCIDALQTDPNHAVGRFVGPLVNWSGDWSWEMGVFP